jgi:hypothetical protein
MESSKFVFSTILHIYGDLKRCVAFIAKFHTLISRCSQISSWNFHPKSRLQCGLIPIFYISSTCFHCYNLQHHRIVQNIYTTTHPNLIRIRVFQPACFNTLDMVILANKLTSQTFVPRLLDINPHQASRTTPPFTIILSLI